MENDNFILTNVIIGSATLTVIATAVCCWRQYLRGLCCPEGSAQVAPMERYATTPSQASVRISQGAIVRIPDDLPAAAQGAGVGREMPVARPGAMFGRTQHGPVSAWAVSSSNTHGSSQSSLDTSYFTPMAFGVRSREGSPTESQTPDYAES